MKASNIVQLYTLFKNFSKTRHLKLDMSFIRHSKQRAVTLTQNISSILNF